MVLVKMKETSLHWYRDKLPGVDKHHCQQWHADRGRYVVKWRDQFMGVEIPAGFQASVRTMLPDGRIILDAVRRHKVFRTRHAAFAACEDHSEGRDPKAEYKMRKTRAMKRRPRKKRVSKVSALQNELSAWQLAGEEALAITEAVLESPDLATVEAARKAAKESRGSTIDQILKRRKQRSDKGRKRGPRKVKS